MRVLMVGPGDSIAMQRPLEWASRAGHEVCVAATHDFHRTATTAAYRFVALDMPSFQSLPLEARPAFGDAAWQAAEETAAAQLAQLARDFRPDIVHAHFTGLPTHACVRAGLRPLVTSVWSGLNAGLTTTDAPTLTPQGARIVAASDAIIVESPALVASLREAAEPSARVELIPLGADTRAFRPPTPSERAAWRRTLKVPDDAVVMASPRGWSRVYNHDLVVEAFASARHRFRRPAVLVFSKMGRNQFAGDAQACFDEVTARANELNVGDALRFLPFLPFAMMPMLYGASDAVLNFPSADAFPSTLIEAAACECAIITARLPTYAGTFIESHGALIESGDVRALSEAIASFVNADAATIEARRRNAHELRRIVETNYDEAVFARRMLALYAELTG